MRLKAEQLQNQLNRSLLPLYVVSGDEPLQSMECLDAIRGTARKQGFEERIVLEVDKVFNWNSLMEECASLSLFASQKIIELKMGTQKPGRDGGKVLQEYADMLPEGILLMISCAKMDKSAQNTKWFKALEKQGAIIQVWPVEPTQLPTWIQRRAKTLGKSIDTEAARFITARVEGNLMAASQEINKLCLLVDDNEIHMEDVLYAVVDNARYDIFSLMESAYTGDLNRAWRMLNGLKTEGLEPMAIYGGLMWEYRRLCSMAYQYQESGNMEQIFSSYRVWNNQRKQAIKQVLNRHKLARLHQLLAKAIKIDHIIKSSDRANTWPALLEFLTELAGSNKQQAMNQI